MENLSDKILEKIKEEKITPKPRWEFLLKNYLVWISGILFLIIGSISFAVIAQILGSNDWDIGKQMTGSFVKFVFLTVPYFWIICFGIFAFVIYYNFKYTKGGYKYPFYAVVLGVLFLSAVFGTLFYNVGFGQAVENAFSEKIPLYKTHLDPRVRIWNQPEKGFLMGVIKDIEEEKGFIIKNPKGREWFIRNMRNKDLKRGDMLKIIGEKVDNKNFKANELRPFNPRVRGLFHNAYPVK